MTRNMNSSNLPEWAADLLATLPPLLTVAHVAVVLNVHHKTVRKLITDRKLVAIRNQLGYGRSRILVPRLCVVQWLRDRVVV